MCVFAGRLEDFVNWEHLHFFLAVARGGTSSKAAESLGVNHTTVSRRITALEESLGVRLFDRRPSGYLMTQAAEDIFDFALEMEQQALAIERRVLGRDAELHGLLRLTIHYDLANALIVPHLSEFRADYPEIDLEILTTSSTLDLSSREADIAVRLSGKPPEYLVGRKMFPLLNGVYTTREYLERRGDNPPDVIVYRREFAIPEWVTENFSEFRVALSADSISSVHGAVRAGVGIASLPCFQAERDEALVRLDIKMPEPTWGIWVLTHADLRATARVRACKDFLEQTLEAQRATILGEASRWA